MIPNGAIAVSSRRVLLIENSPSDRQLLRTWLASEMIDTYEATDIITALSACQKYLPNLILLQLRLHTWDGFEVIRRLKEDPRTRSIPVIFLSASALTAEKAKGIDMGAVDFVSKPFDSVELLARVNSALRTKALLDLLEQRAHLDGLTELGNRFALRDQLPRMAATCQSRDQRLAVLIADIDHFKRVNDQFGHAAGDEVLRRMAGVLRESVREGDFLARYGGEEFVVVCPNCDMATALSIAERIRSSMADLKVHFRNSLIQTTSCVGVASALGPSFPGDPSELLDRADQSLYRAKAGGRNAVWYWEEESRSPTAARPGSNEPSGAGSRAAESSPSTAPVPMTIPEETAKVPAPKTPVPSTTIPAPIVQKAAGPVPESSPAQSSAPRIAPPVPPRILDSYQPGPPTPSAPPRPLRAVTPTAASRDRSVLRKGGVAPPPPPPPPPAPSAVSSPTGPTHGR
ncbi:MAG: diguanylate cyclase [Isosphaeraceae bacterium]